MSRKKITQQQYSDARGYSYGVALDVGLSAACVYQQLMFWSNVSKGGWFYKSAVDLATELPISKATIDRSIKELKDAGYIEIKIKKANGAATRHIRVYSKCVNGFTQNDQTYRFTQNDQTLNNKETINNNNKEVGGLFNETMVAPFTDAQPTDGPVIEEQATDHPPSSLNRKEATASQVTVTNQDNFLDASAKQINGGLTNQEENVISKELWIQLTNLLTPNEKYKPEFNPILSQVLASVNPELKTQSGESQLLAAVKYRSTDAYIADKPHLKTMSVFLKSEIGGVPVWLSCMTEGNKRKKMF